MSSQDINVKLKNITNNLEALEKLYKWGDNFINSLSREATMAAKQSMKYLNEEDSERFYFEGWDSLTKDQKNDPVLRNLQQKQEAICEKRKQVVKLRQAVIEAAEKLSPGICRVWANNFDPYDDTEEDAPLQDDEV